MVLTTWTFKLGPPSVTYGSTYTLIHEDRHLMHKQIKWEHLVQTSLSSVQLPPTDKYCLFLLLLGCFSSGDAISYFLAIVKEQQHPGLAAKERFVQHAGNTQTNQIPLQQNGLQDAPLGMINGYILLIFCCSKGQTLLLGPATNAKGTALPPRTLKPNTKKYSN